MKNSGMFFLGVMIVGAPHYGIVGSFVMQVMMLIAIVYFGVKGD